MYKYFIVDEENRVDKFLASKINLSRNQIEILIKQNLIKVDGIIVNKTGFKLKIDQKIEILFEENENSDENEELLKNQLEDLTVEIIYEDDDILILNKPSNLTVHKAPSVKDITLVDWLKFKKFSLSNIADENRDGIVHRLDKGTSGIIAIAKTNQAHESLAQQLQDRSMGRYYLALIENPLKDSLIIEKNIARNNKNRLKMGISKDGRDSKTAFFKLLESKNNKYELISAKLFTGRTHQIRVHLSSINRHILGDDLYGFKGNLNKINRFFLHAYILELIHPSKNIKMRFQADLPEDMSDFINLNFSKDFIDEKIDTSSIINSFSIFS